MFQMIVVFICVVAVIALETNKGIPGDPLVIAFIEFTLPTAVFLLCLGVTHNLIKLLIGASSLSSKAERMRAVARGITRSLQNFALFLFFTSAARWLISHYGDGVVAWWLEDPVKAGTSLLAAALMASLGLMTGILEDYGFLGGRKRESATLGAMSSAGSSVVALSDRDISVAAAHEAGHAMLHAALVPVPTDLKINLGSSNGTHGILAFVVAGTRENKLPSKEFAHWEMLTYLAGTVAESFAFKQQSMGATGDHRQWINVAIQYLSCFGEEVFVADASTDAEIKYNRALLRELREAHIHELADFFLVNREVFHELRERLMTQHKLVHEEIKDLFARVVFPEGFPRPTLSASAVEIK